MDKDSLLAPRMFSLFQIIMYGLGEQGVEARDFKRPFAQSTAMNKSPTSTNRDAHNKQRTTYFFFFFFFESGTSIGGFYIGQLSSDKKRYITSKPMVRSRRFGGGSNHCYPIREGVRGGTAGGVSTFGTFSMAKLDAKAYVKQPQGRDHSHLLANDGPL